MNDSRYDVPRDLDAPMPFLVWEFVDVIVGVMILGTGILIDMTLVGFIGMVVVLQISKKLRQGQKRGQIQHLFWRIGIDIDKPMRKNAANPLILEYFK